MSAADFMTGSASSEAGSGGRELSGEGAAWRRAGALLIDSVLIAVVWIVVAIATGGGHAGHHSAGAHTGPSLSLILAGIALLYFFVCEAITGQTLGKKIAGVRVLRRDGGRAGAGAVFVRTMLRMIDGLPFLSLVGLVTILASGSGRRQRLGDLAGNTVVVCAR